VSRRPRLRKNSNPRHYNISTQSKEGGKRRGSHSGKGPSFAISGVKNHRFFLNSRHHEGGKGKISYYVGVGGGGGGTKKGHGEKTENSLQLELSTMK